MSIFVKDLTHKFNKNLPTEMLAIDQVSFEINDGEFVSIIGHTGSGKSTLVQHLNGLLQPDQGSIVINDVDLSVKKERVAIRKKVGMVFQYPEYQLFEETVEKDIAFGPKNMGVSGSALDHCIRNAMIDVGLPYEAFAQKSPFELSGGEKRRVALAGILAMQPEILILDEPMAGLDPKGRNEMLAYLKSLHKRGMTIIMISHSMDDVAELSEQILVMNKGRLIMKGKAKEIFAQEKILKEIGLDLPHATLLAQALREKGKAVPAGICRMKELQDWIISEAKKHV